MNSWRILKTMVLNENIEGLREKRKHMLAQMEQKLQEMHPKEEDRIFFEIPSPLCLKGLHLTL